MSKELTELYNAAGFSSSVDGDWPNTLSVGNSLEKLVKLVIENCANAAEIHARSYSNGEAGIGASGASTAIKNYGRSLLGN